MLFNSPLTRLSSRVGGKEAYIAHTSHTSDCKRVEPRARQCMCVCAYMHICLFVCGGGVPATVAKETGGYHVLQSIVLSFQMFEYELFDKENKAGTDTLTL